MLLIGEKNKIYKINGIMQIRTALFHFASKDKKRKMEKNGVYEREKRKY